MRNRIKRLVSMLMTVVLVCLCVAIPSVDSESASVSSITSQSIRDMQSKIKESQNLQKKLTNNIANAQSKKKELEALKKDTVAYITKLDQEINAVYEQIEEYSQLIIQKEAEIVQITAELEDAINAEETQYEAMKTRIKFIYEQGDFLFVDMIMNAKSFSDFLTKADYIRMLTEYDNKKLEEYTEAREWTEVCKQGLETEKVTLDATKEALELEEQSLSELIEAKEKEVAKYNKDIAAKESQIANYEDELDEQAELIDQLEAEILEEQKRLAALNKVVVTYDGGVFAWPCPAYKRITDEYGYRTDPITGATKFHKGLDLGAPYGSAILAAYDGQVAIAGYDISMGNYIMINHGSGLISIYMHCSKLLVKKDDFVTKGSKIALVGSTGRSTGNHLHFGVKKDGQYVSPWNYFK